MCNFLVNIVLISLGQMFTSITAESHGRFIFSLQETAKLSSRVTLGPFYIPTSHVQVIRFLHLLVNTWCHHNCVTFEKRQFYFFFNLYAFISVFLPYSHWVEHPVLPSSNPQESEKERQRNRN